MVYRYRVSLPGIKGFARVYEVKGSSTLYSFSKKMKGDMSFPQDELVLFKSFDSDGVLLARYGMFDLGAGTIDGVTIDMIVKQGGASFVFFYDTTNARSVIVTCEGRAEEKKGAFYPVLVETKGPDPIEFENGYVAFEDLPDDKKKDPDDDDFDDDDEDDDDGEEEVYDAGEDDE